MVPQECSDTCDPEVSTATDSEFVLTNRVKVLNDVYGYLNEFGVLEFFVRNLPKDGTGCPGWWMFDQMMAHFGDRVVAVLGGWSYGDNLDRVNELTSAGMTLMEAALQTKTGGYVRSHGYTTVAIIKHRLADGKYSSVTALFERGNPGESHGDNRNADDD